MVDKHKPEQVLKSYGQKQAGKLRKAQREDARLKMKADAKEAWESYLAWLQLAGFGFYLAVIVTLVAMAAFLFFLANSHLWGVR